MITTSYIILPFVASPQGGRAPGTPRRANDETEAFAAAERIAIRHPGVVVPEERSDPTRDLFAEPRLVRAIGQVSATVFEALAA